MVSNGQCDRYPRHLALIKAMTPIICTSFPRLMRQNFSRPWIERIGLQPDVGLAYRGFFFAGFPGKKH